MTEGAALFAIPGVFGGAFRQAPTRGYPAAAARSKSQITGLLLGRGRGSLPPDPAAPAASAADRAPLVADEQTGPDAADSREQTQIVAFVDDDASVREALSGLLSAFGILCEGFASAEEFLRSGDLRRVSCLITDVRLNGISGLELLDRLAAMSIRIPTIVISARADGRVRDEALGGGAVQFLGKPIAAAALISSIRSALHGLPNQGDNPPAG